MLVSNKWTAYDVDTSSIVLFRRVASRRVAVAAAVAATIIPSCGIHSQKYPRSKISNLKYTWINNSYLNYCNFITYMILQHY